MFKIADSKRADVDMSICHMTMPGILIDDLHRFNMSVYIDWHGYRRNVGKNILVKRGAYSFPSMGVVAPFDLDML